MDIVSKWLGYDNYGSLLKEIGEMDCSSEFAHAKSVDLSNLAEGTLIRIKYEPSRIIDMSYLGDGEFLINDSRNSKLLKGDRIKLTHLILGHELIVKEVIRSEMSLGGYIGAKDGGLVELEIMG